MIQLSLCIAVTLVPWAAQPPGGAYVELVRAGDDALEAAHIQAARQAFEAALELAPRSATCLYGLACVAAREGQLEDAVAHLERAAEQGFDDAALARWDSDLAALRAADLLEPLLNTLLAKGSTRDGSVPRAWRLVPRDSDFNSLSAEPGPPAVASNGARVAIPCSDGTVRILEFASGGAATVLRAGEARLARAAFSPDDKLLATAGDDGRVRLWDLESGAERSSFAAYEEPGFRYDDESGDPLPGAELAFDRAGRRLLTFGAGPRATVWRVDGGEPVAFACAGAASAAWSPDGTRVAIGSSAGSTRLFDPDTGLPAGPELLHRGAAVHVAFHPGGQFLAVGTTKATAELFDLATGARVRSFSHEEYDVFGLSISWCAFDPSGARLVTTSRDYATARGWTVANGALLWTIDYSGGNPATLHARFQADGRRLFLSGNSAETTRVVDPLDGRTIRDLAGEKAVDLVPSHDGRWVVGVAEEEVRVLDGARLALRHTVVPVRSGSQILVSPAGYVDGDADTLQRLQATLGEVTLPLACLAGALLDPKKVRAASAGVSTTPPRIATLPALELETSGGRIPVPRSGLVVAGAMEDALGLIGLAVETIGEPDATPATSEIEWLDEGHTRARFTLLVSPPPFGTLRSVQVCAIGRSGMLSRPSRLILSAPER